MNDPRNYADFMRGEAEQEREDEAFKAGYPAPLPENQRAFMQTLFAIRAAERLAVATESARYYTCTYRGRLAAERSGAAERAQLDATKETR